MIPIYLRKQCWSRMFMIILGFTLLDLFFYTAYPLHHLAFGYVEFLLAPISANKY